MCDSVHPLRVRLGDRVTAAFTTRVGGVSDPPWAELNLATHVGDDPHRVYANRALVSGWLRCPPVWFPGQEHKARVGVVDSVPPAAAGAAHPGVDALVTAWPGVGLGVLVADCVPLLLADPVAGVIGVAHAGRRGLVAGIVQATLQALFGLGAQAGRLRAVLGPAIGG